MSKPRVTAKQLWENADVGQAFACRFIPEEGTMDDEPEVVWVKGDVDTLVWDSVLWIAPVEYGERAYR